MLKGSKEEDYDFDPTIRPSNEVLDRAYEYVSSMWKLILDEVSAYKFVTENRSDFSNKVREARKPESLNSLLFKPAAQEAFVKGILTACEPQNEEIIQNLLFKML